MTAQLRPRPDHVAELTRGVVLPLQLLSVPHLQVITETIVDAWHHLTEIAANVLLQGSEAEITDLLVSRLNHLCTTAPLWSQLVRCVVRGREALSFDGTHLERRPDVSIYLTGLHPSFPFTVECKIISRGEAKTVALYCCHGVIRFVTGQYAWSDNTGMMLAYVRDGSTIPGELAPHLEKSAGLSPDPLKTSELPSQADQVHPLVYASKHKRNFSYLSGGNPGGVVLHHLWLQVADEEL